MKKTFLLVIIVLLLINIGMSGEKRQSVPGVKTVKLTDQIYKFFVHNYVNFFLFKGRDGTLLIDSGFKPVELIQQELKKMGVAKIRYIINTHSNGDHVNGNVMLGQEAVIIAHRWCREDMAKKEGFPKIGLPDLVFDQRMTLHFNGDTISLFYMPGHTGNDIVVHFKKAKVVFLGDLVFSDSFPGIQATRGGSAFVLEKTVGKIVKEFPDDVIFFVGHGRDYTMTDLKKYHAMIQKTIAVVLPMIKKGMSLTEIKNRNPLKKWKNWDSKFFPGEITTDTWIENIYDSYKPKNDYQLLKGPYLGQKPPGKQSRIFAPGIICKAGIYTLCSGFMNNGKLFIYSQNIPGSDWRYKPIFVTEIRDGKWCKPYQPPFYNLFPYNFTVAPDGRTLYFTSIWSGGVPRRLLKKANIWKVEYTHNGWSQAEKLGPRVNTREYYENYPSVTRTGTLYYMKNHPKGYGSVDVVRHLLKPNGYSEMENLGKPVNTKTMEADPFIAADESYLIFCSDYAGGYGKVDMYISFKKKNGKWTKPVNMGPEINTSDYEYRPSVTPDGKYLFFSRGNENPDWGDIFWISAKVINKFRPKEK